MSVTIILQAPNTATITQTGAVSATIQQSGAVSATIQQVVGQGVSVQNVLPNSVTINTGGASGGGSWGSITGTITDQTDLVTYVNRTRTSFDMQSQDGSTFTIVVNNAGQLLVIPEGSTAPVITTLPTTTGTEKVWYTLAAIAGDVTGSPTPTRTWQWQRSANGTDWANISGADTTTYTLVADDANKYIRVQQTEANVLGSVTASSAATGLISASVFTSTQWQNINPVTWEALTDNTWN
jgi:hypothetical protein